MRPQVGWTSPDGRYQTRFSVDLSAFAGQTVQLDVEAEVGQTFYDIILDNFVID